MGDLLYVGSCSGVFYAFDRGSGKVRWTHDTAQDGQAASFHGDPLVAGDLIVVGTDASEVGHLYAFERRTGAIRWMRPYGRGVRSDILRRGSFLYALTMAGELLCLDIATGEERWTVPPEETGDAPHRRSGVLLHGDRLFFTGAFSLLHAVEAASGTEIWTTDLGGNPNTSLARIGDSLYVGTQDERFLRVDAATGKILDVAAPGGMPFGTPVVVDGSILLLVQPASLVRLSPSMELEWVAMTDGNASTFRPLPLGDSVLVGDEAGVLYFVGLDDGMPRRRLPFEGTLRGLGQSDGTLYIGTLKGMVYAYRP